MLQVITVVSIAVLVALDQLIKLLVIEYLEPIGSLPLIDGFLCLKYAENTGAAFGSFSEHTNALSIFTFVVILFGEYLFRLMSPTNQRRLKPRLKARKTTRTLTIPFFHCSMFLTVHCFCQTLSMKTAIFPE